MKMGLVLGIDPVTMENVYIPVIVPEHNTEREKGEMRDMALNGWHDYMTTKYGDKSVAKVLRDFLNIIDK